MHPSLIRRSFDLHLVFLIALAAWLPHFSRAAGFAESGQPDNVKGICASAPLQRLYVHTIGDLISFDLTTDAIVWEKKYDGGCDRMASSPDGKSIYPPSFGRDHWHVLDAASGDVVGRLEPNPGAHNTNSGADGKEAYLAGLHSATLAIADTATRKIIARLTDENGAAVHGEKMLEIDFAGGKAVRAGCQFGVGTVRAK